MKLRTFAIEIKDGKPSFKTEYNRELFYKFLAQFEGEKVWLTVDPRKPKRSLQQNNYYHLYLGIIARETGYTPLELHTYFKGKYLTSGITEVFGSKVRKVKSTTALNKSEFSEYILQIAEEVGITPPDTSDYTYKVGIN